MEVFLPQVQSQFDFCNPAELAHELDGNINGSYSHQLAQFLQEETQSLRANFSVYNIPDWEEYFDASRDIVRSTLELIWYGKFDISEYRRKVLKLDEMKKNAETKLEGFKREIDELPFWRKAVLHYGSAFETSLRETRDKILGGMWPHLKELFDLYNNLGAYYNKTVNKNQMKLNRQIQEHLEYEGENDEGFFMRRVLLHRQQVAGEDNVKKALELEDLFKNVLDIQRFLNEWYGWIHGQMSKRLWRSLGINHGLWATRFVLHVNNLDPLRVEAVDANTLVDVPQSLKDHMVIMTNRWFLLGAVVGAIVSEFDIVLIFEVAK